jgi:hypothetical protein
MLLNSRMNVLTYFIAAGIAIGCIALGSYLQSEHLYSQAKLAGLWLKICYPVFILLSLIVSLIFSISPWIWATVLAASTYISIRYVFGAQAPPFEILLMAALAIPYIVASYIGLFIKRRYGK